MVHSCNGNTDFFDIVNRVLQGDTLAPYRVVISLNYTLEMSKDLMKENGLTKKDKKQISHRDYHRCRLHR